MDNKVLFAVVGTSEKELASGERVLADVKEHRDILFMLCDDDNFSKNKTTLKNAVDRLNDLEMLFILNATGQTSTLQYSLELSSIAKERGIVSVVFVADDIGNIRERRIEKSLDITKVKESADGVVIVPINEMSTNDVFAQNTRLVFDYINELVLVEGVIYLDIEDLTYALKNSGFAYMGIGRASGENRAEKAVNMAFSNLIPKGVCSTAHQTLINFVLKSDIELNECENIVSMINKNVHSDANCVYAVTFEENPKDEISIYVVVADFVESQL